MSIPFEVRKRRVPTRLRKRREPTAREMKFLKAVAAGNPRPSGCGPASYFCLLHGWVEPLPADQNGTVISAGKVTMSERFKESELRWRSAGFALTLKGAAIVRTKASVSTE